MSVILMLSPEKIKSYLFILMEPKRLVDFDFGAEKTQIQKREK